MPAATMSGRMLYQAVGRSSGFRLNCRVSVIAALLLPGACILWRAVT